MKHNQSKKNGFQKDQNGQEIKQDVLCYLVVLKIKKMKLGLGTAALGRPQYINVRLKIGEKSNL